MGVINAYVSVPADWLDAETPEPEPGFDIDKAGDELADLLADAPFDIIDGDRLTAAEVRASADYLAATPWESLAHDLPDDEADYVRDHYERLRAFFAHAAESGHAVVIVQS
ncbi:DUF1877 family protein [Herbidospora mongoliensis]|uniref:DUF1877 family protein n=1 Tax=Herbidospora mongoliensis TaxID=688067 RepID=UPI00082F5C19|nr:DUF1877 family protein [Herbidospora mongoliensis]